MRKVIHGFALMFAAAAVAALSLGNALAADFYVATNGNDGGDGSQATPFATLGAAIAAADAAIAGGGIDVTIHVAAGTYVGSGHVLSNAITVVGAGADGTVVDGNGGYRVFSLLSSGAALKGLCVSNGMFAAAGDMGAGVYMEAGIVEDCLIASCGNTKNVCYGGGIYASGGRIRRTTFTGCRVHMNWGSNTGYGAALYLSNGAVCENSLFTGNAAPQYNTTWMQNGNRRGGVVHLTDTGTALVNCTVVKNQMPITGDKNVTDKFAGIVQKSGAKVVGCVAYMNVPGNFETTPAYGDVVGSSSDFICSAWDAAAISGSFASPVAIDANSFVDYNNGNYAPATSGPLFNAGSDADYATYATSATDLAGVARSQGSAIDIGCYEVDLSTLEVVVAADSYGVLLGSASSFTATATGGSGSYTYRWDFGDGSAAQTTASAAVTHTYAAAGLYHATVSVSDNGGTTWGATGEPRSAIVVAPADLYVDAAGASPAFPYATPAKAAASFADAFTCLTNTLEDTAGMAVVDGVTIHVASGTYAGSGFVLAGAITVDGAGAESTVFDGNGGYRVFSLLSPGATLKNLCVSNGMFTASGDKGAGVYMESGLVEDCMIASCGNTTDTTYGGGIYAIGGRISRTTFTGCKVHMAWGYKGYGSALYLSNGAVCENSLFTGNAAPSYDTTGSYKYRGGVVYLTDAGTALVNCTVAKNRIARGGSGNADKNFAGIVQRSGATVVNCVAYMNCPSDFDAATTAYGDVIGAAANFVHSAWNATISGSSPASPVTVDESAFKNYANGNFVPKSGGVLVKGGTSWADYLDYGAQSTTDLDGKARRNGKVLDIGCYKAADASTVILMK
jgi:hypothetical protein